MQVFMVVEALGGCFSVLVISRSTGLKPSAATGRQKRGHQANSGFFQAWIWHAQRLCSKRATDSHAKPIPPSALSTPKALSEGLALLPLTLPKRLLAARMWERQHRQAAVSAGLKPMPEAITRPGMGHLPGRHMREARGRALTIHAAQDQGDGAVQQGGDGADGADPPHMPQAGQLQQWRQQSAPVAAAMLGLHRAALHRAGAAELVARRT